MQKPLVSVIISSYNRCEILKQCLNALFNQTLPSENYEVIVVDDCSSDNTWQYLSTLSPPCVLKIFRQSLRQGQASGRNRGLKEANGKYIVFIDDDIIAHKDLLKEHLLCHNKRQNLVVRGRVNHFSDKLPSKPRFTISDISFNFFWTSNVSIEKKHLEKAGYFDESFNKYGWEDNELGFRLRRLGLHSIYHRKALAYHYKPPLKVEDLEGYWKRYQEKGETAVLFYKKHSYFRVKLSTGILYYRLILFLYPEIVINWIKKFLLNQPPKLPLSRWKMYLVNFISDYYYYKSIANHLLSF